MSRIAYNPISVPAGVELNIAEQQLTAKGSNGELQHKIHPLVKVMQEDGVLKTAPLDDSREAKAMAGTTRMLVYNLIIGVSKGFERRLEIHGVGYRAQMQGNDLQLLLGFSHPVIFKVPVGIVIATPSQTEIVIKGADKQQVGQVAADIRAFRPPEPYKGKGVRYTDETVLRKEAKKS